MKCYLYYFEKKPKSTKQPTGIAHIEREIYLKDATSLINPTIIFSDGLNHHYINHNYLYIPDFKRYYFVREWTYIERTWQASCTCDVMASFKDPIINTPCYVLRCANASAWDLRLTDDAYPLRSQPDIKTATSNVGMTKINSSSDYANGTIIVGILGKSNGQLNSGMCNFYALNAGQFNTFKNYLFADINAESSFWDNPVDMSEINAFKAYVDPMQYILTCRWFPVDLINLPTTGLQEIKMGYYQMRGCLAHPISNAVLRNNDNLCNITIPRRSNYANYNYMYDAPYAIYTLYYKPLGCIQLPLKHAAESGAYISIGYTLDLVTGDCMFEIREHSSEGENVLVTTNINLSVAIPLVQSAVNIQAKNSTTQSVASAVGSLFSGNIFGAASAAISAAQSSKQAQYPVISSTGGLGSMATMTGAHSPILFVEYFDITTEDIADRGKPCCKRIAPSKLGDGYILASDVHVEAGTQTDREAIKQIMESGFYLE